VKPVVVPDATAHPRFKYFRGRRRGPVSGHSSACPVIDRGVLQGVLVVQTRESRAFTDEDVRS
jgi:starch phosphorylase